MLKQPRLAEFDGTQDPRAHFQDVRHKLRFEGFPMTVNDYARTWFYSLPPWAIKIWDQLSTLFIGMLFGFVEFSKPIGQHMRLKQKLDETLK